jgi:hypothetical protein
MLTTGAVESMNTTYDTLADPVLPVEADCCALALSA